MKKTLLLFFCFFFSVAIFSQTEISEENSSLEIVKAKKISALSLYGQGNHGKMLSGKGKKNLALRLSLIRLNREETPVPPNKVSFCYPMKLKRDPLTMETVV